MSAVPCLPAYLCVSAAASRGQAPHGNASRSPRDRYLPFRVTVTRFRALEQEEQRIVFGFGSSFTVLVKGKRAQGNLQDIICNFLILI